MVTTHEGVDALYTLTMHLPANESKLGKPTFKKNKNLSLFYIILLINLSISFGESKFPFYEKQSDAEAFGIAVDA